MRILGPLCIAGGLYAAAACGGGEDSASTQAMEAPAASDAPAPEIAEPADVDSGAVSMASDAAAEVPAEQPVPAGGGAASFPVVPVPGRSIAYSAGMTLESTDIAESATRIGDIVAAAGGTVFDANIDLATPGAEFGSLTVKVPPEGLGTTIAKIGALGRVTNRSQDAEDVTAQVIDLDARILTAEASVERVRSFLAATTKVSELAEIEAELTRRETDLEVLLAQQRNLGERVSLATLTIELLSPALVEVIEPVEIDEPTTVGSAFRAGGRAVWSTLRGVAIGIAAAIPVLAVILPIAFVGWLLASRYRRRHPRRPTPGPRPLPDPPLRSTPPAPPAE